MNSFSSICERLILFRMNTRLVSSYRHVQNGFIGFSFRIQVIGFFNFLNFELRLRISRSFDRFNVNGGLHASCYRTRQCGSVEDARGLHANNLASKCEILYKFSVCINNCYEVFIHIEKFSSRGISIYSGTTFVLCTSRHAVLLLATGQFQKLVFKFVRTLFLLVILSVYFYFFMYLTSYAIRLFCISNQKAIFLCVQVLLVKCFKFIKQPKNIIIFTARCTLPWPPN